MKYIVFHFTFLLPQTIASSAHISEWWELMDRKEAWFYTSNFLEKLLWKEIQNLQIECSLLGVLYVLLQESVGSCQGHPSFNLAATGN